MNATTINNETARLQAIADDETLANELGSLYRSDRVTAVSVNINLHNNGRIGTDFDLVWNHIINGRPGDEPDFIPGDKVAYRDTVTEVLWTQPRFSGGWDLMLANFGLVHESRVKAWNV